MLPNVGLMVGHRLLRWLNINPPLTVCLLFHSFTRNMSTVQVYVLTLGGSLIYNPSSDFLTRHGVVTDSHGCLGCLAKSHNAQIGLWRPIIHAVSILLPPLTTTQKLRTIGNLMDA